MRPFHTAQCIAPGSIATYIYSYTVIDTPRGPQHEEIVYEIPNLYGFMLSLYPLSALAIISYNDK